MYCFLLLGSVIEGKNVLAFEDDGEAVVQIKRRGSLKSVISGYVTTVDETAKGTYAQCVIFK